MSQWKWSRSGKWAVTALSACFFLLLLRSSAEPQIAPAPPHGQESYGDLPLLFEPNQGQADRHVRFLSRSGGCSLFLTGDEVVISRVQAQRKHNQRNFELKGIGEARQNSGLKPRVHAAGSLRMQLVGAAPQTKIVGLEEAPAKST